MVVHARRNRIVAVLPSAKKRSNETLAEFIDRFRVHFRYHKSSKHEEKDLWTHKEEGVTGGANK